MIIGASLISPAQVASIAVLFILAYGLLLAYLSSRIAQQRAYVQRFRTFLHERLGWVNLKRAGEGWENKTGAKLMACGWVFQIMCTTIMLLYEGNFFLVTQLVPSFAAFVYCLAKDKSKHVMLAIARFTLLHQVVMLCAISHVKMAPVTMRRIILVRTVSLAVFFESLEEALLHSLLMCATVYWRRESFENIATSSSTTTHSNTAVSSTEINHLLALPLLMYLLGVLPMHVLGISEWLSASAKESDFSRQTALRLPRGVSFLACVIPIHICLGAFLLYPGRLATLVMGLAFFTLGVLMRIPYVALRMNRWVAPCTLAFHNGLQQRQRQAAAAAGAGGGGEGRMNRGRALRIVFGALLLALLKECRLHEQRATFVLLVTVAMIAVLIQDKLHSQVHGNLFLLMATALLLGFGDAHIGALFSFIGVVASVMCVLMTSAKETIFSRIALENQAEAFLSHAIKQKFASVGAAVEQVFMSQRQLDRSTMTPCTEHRLLQMVVSECRTGHARCHASSIYRKLTQGEQRPPSKRELLPVEEQIRTTAMAAWLLTPSTAFVGLDGDGGGVGVVLDWELFHLVLTELARKRYKVEAVWFDNVECTLGVRLDCTVKRSNMIFARLLEELDAKVQGNAFVFKVKKVAATAMVMALQSPRLAKSRWMMGAPSPLGTAAKLSQAASPSFVDDDDRPPLSTLRFALVDDNALIRKNFEHLLRRTLGVPQENIWISGASLQACRDFPQHIVDRNVDIAIFDQNLDFDDDAYVKGSDLAQEAKQLGFSGCLILHSSDVNLPQLLEQGVFHSAVEKTADPAKFVHDLARAWDMFQLAATASSATAAATTID